MSRLWPPKPKQLEPKAKGQSSTDLLTPDWAFTNYYYISWGVDHLNYVYACKNLPVNIFVVEQSLTAVDSGSPLGYCVNSFRHRCPRNCAWPLLDCHWTRCYSLLWGLFLLSVCSPTLKYIICCVNPKQNPTLILIAKLYSLSVSFSVLNIYELNTYIIIF